LTPLNDALNARAIRVVGPGEGEVYSPHEVPPGINMSLEDWQALSDVQRQLIGDRRFARPVDSDTLG
jgi:hypothetical protein